MNANVRFVVIIAGVVVLGVVLWTTVGPLAGLRTPGETAPAPTAKSPDAPASSEEPSASFSPETRPSSAAPVPEQPTLSGTRVAGQNPQQALPTGVGKIIGTVKMKGTEQPVSGAKIVLESSDDREKPPAEAARWETTSNAAGQFTFTRLPIKYFSLVASKGDLSGADGTNLEEDEPSKEIELWLDATGSIAGRVRVATGEALPGVLVLPQETDNRQAGVNGTALRTVSDEQGAFRIDYLPAKMKYKLAAKAKDYAVQVTDFVAVGASNVEIVLTRGGTASGTVTTAETHQPVPSISVNISGNNSFLNRQSASTDDKGQFTFTALADGDYGVSIEDPTRFLVGQPPPVTIRDGGRQDGLALVVVTGGVITGRVYNVDTGDPIEGIKIRADSQENGPRREAASAADGQYRIEGLGGGTYQLRRLWKPGWLHGEDRESKTVVAKVGEQIEGIDFPVKYGLFLRGRVVDTAGKPVSHATVSSEEVSNNGEGEETLSREDGSFEHRGFSAHAQIMVRAKKGSRVAPPLGPLTFGEEDLTGVELVMEKAGSIAGVVVDRAGKPVEQLYLSAFAQNTGTGGSAQSDADGKFKIDGLLAGLYTIQMYAPNNYSSRSANSDPIEVAKSQDVTGVRLVFDADSGLSIEGRVTNRKGEAVKQAWVNAYSPTGNSNGSAQTDDDGLYAIRGLREGTHYVNVGHSQYSPAQVQDVAAGTRNLNFVLDGLGAIEGRVVDAQTGRPVTLYQLAQIQGADVQVGPNMGSGTTYANPDGSFRLERVPVGDVTLVVKAPSYTQASQTVTGVQAGETVTGIMMRLEAGGVVEGTVRNAAGRPVANAQVSLQQPNPWDRGRGVAATTTAEGSFRLDSLPDTPFQIWVVHVDYAQAVVSVTPTSGRVTTVDIVLDQGGSIEGVVRVGGKPMAGQHVYAQMQATPETPSTGPSTATTDADGKYAINGLTTGEAYVNAQVSTGANSARNSQRQAQVASGQVTVVDFDFIEGNATVEGTVTVDGRPAAQGHIGATFGEPGQNAESIFVQIGSDGKYQLKGLPAGTVTLQVGFQTSTNQWRSQSATVETVAGRVTHRDLAFSEGITLTGTVSGLAQGEYTMVIALQGSIAVTEIGQDFWMANRDKMAGQAGVEAGGNFSLSLEPGTYTIVAIGQNNQTGVAGARFATQAVTLSGHGEVTVNLALP